MIHIYSPLRLCLSVILILSLIPIRHWLMRIFFCAVAVEHMLPSMLWSASWRGHIFLPLRLTIMLLSAAISVNLYLRATKGLMWKKERRELAMVSVLLALAVGAAGWSYRAEDGLQAFNAIRQYFYLGMTVSWASAWLWVRWIRPVTISYSLGGYGWSWLAWLAASLAGASTGKGGIAWLLMDRSVDNYYALSDLSMATQLIAVAGVSVAAVFGAIGEELPD